MKARQQSLLVGRSAEFFLAGLPVPQGDMKPHRWMPKEIRSTVARKLEEVYRAHLMRNFKFDAYREAGALIAYISRSVNVRLIHAKSAELNLWRKMIARRAARFWEGPPSADRIKIKLQFQMERPPSVTREFPTKRGFPDGDKLERAVFDALTGIVFVDDSQITDQAVLRRYDKPGVLIRVSEVLA